jgi:hypothetical protein
MGLIVVNIDYARPIDISADFAGLSPEPVSSPAVRAESSHPVLDIEPVAVLDRPIFSPTRRQFTPAPIEEAAPPSPEEVVEPVADVSAAQPEIELQGTRRIGSSFAALVRDPPSDTYDWVAVGETLQGWAVERVGENELTLTSNGSLAVYSLYPQETNAVP